MAGIQAPAEPRGCRGERWPQRRWSASTKRRFNDDTNTSPWSTHLTALEPRVLYVNGRDRAVLDGYFDSVGEAGCARIEMVAMDKWSRLHRVGALRPQLL